jgi:membrane protein DedA with SNARE-associated domain
VLLASVTSSLTSNVRDHGLYAVFGLMFVDAFLPAASELVMVVAGAVAAGALGGSVSVLGVDLPQGFWSYVAVSLAGTLGYTLGSLAAWWIGWHGGRPLLERHGRWLRVGPEELARAEAWFERYEDWAVFVGRITPVVRSFVSIPAGVFRVPLVRYTILTLAGSALWCFVLAGVGWIAGASYESFHHDFGFAEIAVAAGALALGAYLILRRWRASTLSRRASRSDSPR